MIRALVVVAVLSSDARAEFCSGGPLTARPVIGENPRMAGSGGMIVIGDTLPDWRFRSINKVVRAHVVTLAPGLAIYHPPPLPGDIAELENAEHRLMARAQRVFAIEKPLDPPQITKVIAQATNLGGNVVASVENTPASARIAIISRVDGARTVPLSWSMVNAGQVDIVLWQSPGSCRSYITSWIPPKAGERVVVTWVDDAGRVSEPSKPLTISGPPRGK